MKVMVVVGTRPELIRLSRILARLKGSVELVLVHTGQNYAYELGDIFFEDLGIDPPKHYLSAVGPTLAETMGLIISRTDKVLESEAPDALLVLGDTNSALSVIPAKRRKIPVFHYEAGNRCFDQRVPEEINRKIVDHVSDINLTYSDIAKQNLLREGWPMDRVFNIGSPMREVLEHYREKIRSSDVVSRLGLKAGEYFVLSAHREENVDAPERIRRLVDCLSAVLDTYGFPILFSIHPRTLNRIKTFGIRLDERIRQSAPLGFTDYVALQSSAYCVLSDSGTITEESSILDFPAVNLRETHERIEGMEKGAVTMTGFDPERVLLGISAARRQCDSQERLLDEVPDYMQTNVSDKVLRIILSYTSYINQKVWYKEV